MAAAKLLLLASRAAPDGKTRSSPALGATFPAQLAAVVQLLSAPPPSHVLVASGPFLSSDTPSLAGAGK